MKTCGELGNKNFAYKHGHSTTPGGGNSPTYNTWHLMKQRCHNPKAPDYRRYGGRGIIVCPEWRKAFGAFLSDMGTRPTGMTLDRIDNDAGYSKENCRWLPKKLQHRNTSQSKWITYRGETRVMVEWAEILSLPYRTLKQRIANNWPVERAFTQPHRRFAKGARQVAQKEDRI